MRQLSGLDNVFLELEDDRAHMHVASLGIYDPASAPGGHVRFKTVLDFFSGKIKEVDFFRQRMVKAPLGLDRPYRIDDPNVDVEYHVRHIALPHPGDWRQLMIQVARLHSRPLDLSRPLWEVYIIGGLDNIDGVAKGSFAVYIKLHHSAIDGQAGVQLMSRLHTLSPDYDNAPKPTVIYADHNPTTAELLVRTVYNRGKRLVEGSQVTMQMGRKLIGLGAKYGPDLIDEAQHSLLKKIGLEEQAEEVKQQKAKVKDKIKTRFDGKISPHRVVDAWGIPLEDFNIIRKHMPGVTINDIFMAASGATLDKYLSAHNEKPGHCLNGMMPLAAVGDQKNEKSSNNVAMAVVPLHNDIADPVQRLLAVRDGASKNKEVQDDLGRGMTAKLLDVIPGPVAAKIMEVGLISGATTVVSNVRGPNVPLYLAGARMQMFAPISIPFDGMGLNITGFSYDGILWVCVVACREMLPDPQLFTQCYRESVDEMIDGAIKWSKKQSTSKAGKTSTKKATVRKSADKKAVAKKAVAKKAVAKKAVAKKAVAKKAVAKKAVAKKAVAKKAVAKKAVAKKAVAKNRPSTLKVVK